MATLHYRRRIGRGLVRLASVNPAKTAARNEQQASERKAIDKAKEVQNEISSMADDDINRRLTSWLRGGKR